MDLDDVLAAVERASAVTGVGTQPWPDPHPDGVPDADEYSRCEDPGKYRIVVARAEAWARALVDTGLATSEPVGDLGSAWRDGLPQGHAVTRGWWLRPGRSGAVPLLLCPRAGPGEPESSVAIGAGVPAVLLAVVPHCGCDACDDGSAAHLAEVDARVIDVVCGDLVHVTTPTGTAIRHRDGWSASGIAEPVVAEQLLGEARAGRSPHPVVRGAKWW